MLQRSNGWIPAEGNFHTAAKTPSGQDRVIQLTKFHPQLDRVNHYSQNATSGPTSMLPSRELGIAQVVTGEEEEEEEEVGGRVGVLLHFKCGSSSSFQLFLSLCGVSFLSSIVLPLSSSFFLLLPPSSSSS